MPCRLQASRERGLYIERYLSFTVFSDLPGEYVAVLVVCIEVLERDDFLIVR